MTRVISAFVALALCCASAACSDDDPHVDPAAPGGKQVDAGTGKPKPDAGGGTVKPDAGAATGALERPGTLPRPPKGGLPADLRPPR